MKPEPDEGVPVRVLPVRARAGRPAEDGGDLVGGGRSKKEEEQKRCAAKARRAAVFGRAFSVRALKEGILDA